MYTMKQVCDKLNLKYDTLKYYCNEGLVPNVKRDKNNYRVFDDADILWIDSLTCLKKCDMSILEMKEYLQLCLIGKESIRERKKMLDNKLINLEIKAKEISDSIKYINNKHKFYDNVLNGKEEYHSNLISKK